MPINEEHEQPILPDDCGEVLRQSAKVLRERMAAGAYEMLSAVLVALKLNRCVELHREHHSIVLDHLARKRALCSLIQKAFALTTQAADGHSSNDPWVLAQTAVFIGLLLELYVPAFDNNSAPIVRDELRTAAHHIVVEFVKAIKPQAEVLKEIIVRVTNAANGHSNVSRIVLLEFPLGNSIPCMLLKHQLLAKGFSVETVRVALSRNDRAAAGITREELLRQKLSEASLSVTDLVIHMDEWVTGVNYARISSLLRELVAPSRALLLPVGLLATEAQSDSRWAKFSTQHDALVGTLGLRGVDFRFVFPAISTKCKSTPPFFWAEYDRLAGYRKMQLYGSIYSSIAAAVEELHTNAQALRAAKYRFLQTCAERTERTVPRAALESRSAFKELYDESYCAYQRLRPDLEKLNHESNYAEVSDTGAAMDEIAHALSQQVEGDKAKFCLLCAAIHLANKMDTDPKDRYYFKNHVPAVTELTGELRVVHEFLMQELHKLTEIS